MKHLSLSVSHVALQLGQQCDSTCSRHIFKHIFLPVLAHGDRILGYVGGEVATDNLLLLRVVHHSKDTGAERVDGIE